jgi:hypothetical protein
VRKSAEIRRKKWDEMLEFENMRNGLPMLSILDGAEKPNKNKIFAIAPMTGPTVVHMRLILFMLLNWRIRHVALLLHCRCIGQLGRRVPGIANGGRSGAGVRASCHR